MNRIEQHPLLTSAMSVMKTSSSCQSWTGLEIVVWSYLVDFRYFHYKRHYHEMAQRPFQDANHTAVEEKVLKKPIYIYLQTNKDDVPTKNANLLILYYPIGYWRQANISGT